MPSGSRGYDHQAVGNLFAVGYRRSRATSARRPWPSTVSSFVSATSSRPGRRGRCCPRRRAGWGQAAGPHPWRRSSPSWQAATGWPTRVVLSSWAEPALARRDHDQDDAQLRPIAAQPAMRRCGTWAKRAGVPLRRVRAGEVRREEFLYELKAGPAGGLRPPSGPAATRRQPGSRPRPHVRSSRKRSPHLELCPQVLGHATLR